MLSGFALAGCSRGLAAQTMEYVLWKMCFAHFPQNILQSRERLWRSPDIGHCEEPARRAGSSQRPHSLETLVLSPVGVFQAKWNEKLLC